jgi:hypothetical protein
MADLMVVLESRDISVSSPLFRYLEGPPCLSGRPRLLTLALGTMHVWGVAWHRERVCHPALQSSGLKAAIPLRSVMGKTSLCSPNRHEKQVSSRHTNIPIYLLLSDTTIFSSLNLLLKRPNNKPILLQHLLHLLHSPLPAVEHPSAQRSIHRRLLKDLSKVPSVSST